MRMVINDAHFPSKEDFVVMNVIIVVESTLKKNLFELLREFAPPSARVGEFV